MSKDIQPHVLEFYEAKKLLGSGAYGHVWKVTDKKTQQTLALKKIFDAFQNSTDAQRTYREISLLHQMEHKNIIKLHKVIKAMNKRDLYLVFQHMESDLHSLVGQSILTANHLTFVLFQILKALKYMHSAQLIHRDLKPSNVLINSECEIKICDFGLARSLAHEEHVSNILSEEVATRWYRSPQMLLGGREYGKPTDVWSVGCIVAELLIGEPIFPGNSTLNQLQKIIEFTGIPSKESVDSLKSQCAQSILNNLNVRNKLIKQYFRKCDKETSQLIKLTIKMLDFNPNKRLTVEQLLSEPIFSEFHQQSVNEEQEICRKFITHEIDDNTKLTLQEYRRIIYKDIERRYPQFNDVCRIKSIIAVHKKKHRSLIQKNNKKEEFVNHSHSFVAKSLPKTAQSSNVSPLTKKSVLKKDILKNTLQQINVNANYLKSKFYKTTKAQKLKSVNESVSNIKEMAKPHYLMDLAQVKNNELKEIKNGDKKDLKVKKQSKQHKQNSPTKKHTIQQEEKAIIYKTQLKRMKSNKNLVKTKIQRPKFERQKSTTKLNK